MGTNGSARGPGGPGRPAGAKGAAGDPGVGAGWGPESAPGAPEDERSAYTPPDGIPLVVLPPEDARWQDRMRAMIRLPATERPAPAGPAPAPSLSVPRVLDLALRIGDLLLSGGEGAEDVEAA